MRDSNLPPHGGDLFTATARFRCTPWLDLSTGINPWPYPVLGRVVEDWNRLPESGTYAALCTAAADYYGASSETAIVVAPGTQSLIQWLPYLTGQLGESLRVAVVAPTYTEHAIAWQAAGHLVTNIALSELDAIAAEIVIIVNPNNPDGRIYQPEYLLRIANTLRLLVIDESFADTKPEVSVIPFLHQMSKISERIVVLRSFSKFFGLAGMRLGFALTGQARAKRLKTALGPWAVGGTALRVGIAALSDKDWITETRISLHEAVIRLDMVLTEVGIVSGGTDLFRLVDCGTECRDLYERLGRAGILVRAFTYLPSKLRFGLPSCEESLQKLKETLLSL